MRDDVRKALVRMVQESGTHSLLAAQLKRTFGWECSDRDASGRLSRMLSPSDEYNPKPDALTIFIEVTQLDYITPILHRAHLRAQLEQEAKDDGEPGRAGTQHR